MRASSPGSSAPSGRTTGSFRARWMRWPRCCQAPPVRSDRPVSGLAQLLGEDVDPTGDLVADQPHPVDALDASFGWFVGVPDLDRRAAERFDVGVAGEHDDPVPTRDYG